MTTLAEGIVAKIEEHPYMSAGIAVGVVLILWYMFSGSGAQPPATQANTQGDAAGLVAAQIAANASTANAAISASVTNNQTAAGEAVALANIQSGTDKAVAQAVQATKTAQYNSTAEIVASNNSVVTSQINASAAETISGNNTLASEYNAIASYLTSYFGKAGSGQGVFANVAFTQSSAGGTKTSATQSSSYDNSANTSGTPGVSAAAGSSPSLWAQLNKAWQGSSWSVENNWNVQYSTPVENPNLTASNSAVISAVSKLLNGLGVGVRIPTVSKTVSDYTASLSHINQAAVNSWSNT